jgi:hypothetical protein
MPLESRSFFRALFDFTFTSFVTMTLIKVLYGIVMVGAVLGALVLIAAGFNQSTLAGILVLVIGAPLYFLLTIIFYRVILEFLIVVFRIERHTAKMANADSAGQPQRM